MSERDEATGTDVGRGLFRVVRWFEDGLLGLMGEAGFEKVSRTQVLLVGEVESDGTSASELARRLGVTRQSVHQDVRKLIAAGVVDQVADPDNRAAKRVVLTVEGERMRSLANAAQDKLGQALRQRLGRDAYGALAGALEVDPGEPLGPSVAAIRVPKPTPAPSPAPSPEPEAVAAEPTPEPEPTPQAAPPAPEPAPEAAEPEQPKAPEPAPAPEPVERPKPRPVPAATQENRPAPRPAPRPGTSGFAFPGLKKPGRPLPGQPARPDLSDRGLPT